MIQKAGHSDPDKTLPVLNTLEFFALKMPKNSDLRQQYRAMDNAAQKRLLKQHSSRLNLESVAIENLANKPQHIEEIEWFASPSDTNKLLAHIAKETDPIAKDIMSISPGVAPGDKKRWDYVGSKGGSEPGVVSFAFLVTSKAGHSYAVSGSWNNPNAPVDRNKFQALMNRLLNLLAEQVQA